jgi:hypothetical protein
MNITAYPWSSNGLVWRREEAVLRNSLYITPSFKQEPPSITATNFTQCSQQPIFFSSSPLLGSSLPYWSTGLITQFRDLSQMVGLLGRVVSSSQGLYLNTEQHKQRITRTHIKHPCLRRDSNPQSRPPSDRRLFGYCDRQQQTYTFLIEFRSVTAVQTCSEPSALSCATGC